MTNLEAVLYYWVPSTLTAHLKDVTLSKTRPGVDMTSLTNLSVASSPCLEQRDPLPSPPPSLKTRGYAPGIEFILNPLEHHGVNSLRPNNDASQTSHCNIKGVSVSEVMRIENMITQVKFY